MLLVAVSLICISSVARAEPVWLTDLDQALAKAAKEKKNVFLDYYAAWCPPCQELDKTVLRAGALGSMEAEFVFVHLDGDALPKSPSYKKYPVTGYPTVWVIDPSGKALGRHVGFDEKKEFLEFMGEALSGKEWTAGLAERLAKSPESADVVSEAFGGALITGDKAKAAELRKKIKGRREDWDGAYQRAELDECASALYAPEPDYAEVIRLADVILTDFPKGYFAPGALHMKAKALRASGKTADADAAVASLPARFADSASAYWRVLEYARLNGVLRKEAAAALEAGLKKFPDDERFLNQAVLFLRDSDAARAGAIAASLKKLKPDNAYYDDLIRSLGKGGKRDG
jgi:thiol-disulfide isomerase/thioredoxin